MRQETIEILKKHGCLYMASDYRDLIEEIEEHYTSEQQVKNLSLSAVSVNEVAVCSCKNPDICQDTSDLVYCFKCKKPLAN